MKINYDKLREDFVVESMKLINSAEDACLALETAFDPASVDEILRCVHTIKGNSGLFDATAIHDFAHSLEDRLCGLRAGSAMTPDTIDLILRDLDALRTMIQSGSMGTPEKTGNHPEPGQALLPVQDTHANGNGHSPAQSDQARGKIKIKAAWLKQAENTGNYLTFMRLDLTRQGPQSLDEASRWLESFGPGLLDHGPDVSSPVVDGTLPYFLLMLSPDEPETWIKDKRLNIERKTRVYPRNNPRVSEKSISTPTGIPAPQTSNGGETHLRISLGLIDRLMNLAGETVIARNDLYQIAVQSSDARLPPVTNKLGQLVSVLQENIMRMRLQALEVIFQRLPRVVRDAAQETGKKVRLQITGSEIEVDKSLLDSIANSITHMVRNSVDHGIEDRETRLRLGKPEEGLLRIKASLQGGNVVIDLQDDGRGLNLDKIRQVCVTRGLLTREQAEAMPEVELQQFIFLPGFSTAEQVSGTSGRGVGMDVVQTNFRNIGGSLEIRSLAGEGTQFTAVVPQTLTITSCLMIKAGADVFAIPQQNLVELIHMEESKAQRVENHILYELRGHLIPIIDLQMCMNGASIDDRARHIAIVRTERHRFGLVVDEVRDVEEIVIRPLGPVVARIGLFSGAAIMGDGAAILVLDIPALARVNSVKADAESADSRQAAAQSTVVHSDYLVFRAAGRKFAIRLVGVPRIEHLNTDLIQTFMGATTVKIGSELIPVIRLNHCYRLEQAQEPTALIVIRTLLGVSAIAADSVEGMSQDLAVSADGKQATGVLGVTLIAGEQVIVLDPDTILTASRNIQALSLEEAVHV